MLKKNWLLLFLVAFSVNVFADEPQPIIRTADPLEMSVRMDLPPHITSVAEGVVYVLGSSGYHLVLDEKTLPGSMEIAKRPIPPKAIRHTVVPIYQAILWMIGDDSRLVVDPVQKVISFEKINDE